MNPVFIIPLAAIVSFLATIACLAFGKSAKQVRTGFSGTALFFASGSATAIILHANHVGLKRDPADSPLTTGLVIVALISVILIGCTIFRYRQLRDR
ncbi:MAG: hypothetical protein SGJ20_00925 [Planctomycetota bacterium]|nr:hypothetical protein [Planctomycetota bacterium]